MTADILLAEVEPLLLLEIDALLVLELFLHRAPAIEFSLVAILLGLFNLAEVVLLLLLSVLPLNRGEVFRENVVVRLGGKTQEDG